jgi:hypothetical protein
MNGKKETWFKRIADLIQEERTFDVSRNEDGLKTVSQMIAKKMCDGLSWAQAVQEYPQNCNMVKKNLGNAILYLQEDLKIPVYRLLERKGLSEEGDTKGGKFVEFLTIDRDYRDALTAERERIELLLAKNISSTIRNLQISSPESQPEDVINYVAEQELKKITKKS